MSECPYCQNTFEMEETCSDEFRMWQGLVGPYYYPTIEDGVLTWSNTGGLPNPDPLSVVGPPGNGLTIGGLVETVGDLPETAEPGETWLVGDDEPYTGYSFLNGAWVSIGAVTPGPAGPTGPVGPTGATGSTGATGPAGPVGLEVSNSTPVSDVLAWIDPDEDTEILVPEMHTTVTPNVLDMGTEYLDAAAVYDRNRGQTQEEINSTTITETAITHSGSYSTYINTDYSSFVGVRGGVAMCRVALEFKNHAATNAWVEVATLPQPSLLSNMSQTVITNHSNPCQVRVAGDKLYVNLLTAVTQGELISAELIYFV